MATDEELEGPLGGIAGLDALGRTELAPVAITSPSARASQRRAVTPDLADTASMAGTAAFAATAAVSATGTGDSAGAERAVFVSGDLPNLTGPERYETGVRIGSGGMGEVVLQVDRNIGRAVAKKMLHPEVHGQVSVQRFIREARVQGQLEHPAVVPVHDFGVDADGRLFFSMKRIRGLTLAQILDKLLANDREFSARFSRHKLLSSFVQVCLAIEYAHKRGVIHRDLKPSNVMLGDFGEVYVLDWGLAKLTTRAETDDIVADRSPAPRTSSPDMTSDGDFLGTPLYMAPEQLLGKHAKTDERADVFGLGAILFEILTLEPYRRGTTLASLVEEVDSTAPIERPSERAAVRGEEIPPALDDLCVSALTRDSANRLGSARALADSLTRYLEGDRDLAARRAQAAELVVSAQTKLEGSTRDRSADLVVATREVMKALALAPDNPDAQRLLVTLLLEGSGNLSVEASRAFEDGEAEVRVSGLRRGAIGLVLWLATLPLALTIGVLDWKVLWVITGLTVASFCFILAVLRSPRAIRSQSATLVLAVVVGIVVALTTMYLGPFVLVPVAACAATVMFLIHLSREEARPLIGVWMLAVFVPFLVEWLHLLPPAYTFVHGEIILHPRLLHLPEATTTGFLMYTSVSFVGGIGWIVSALRSKQREAERRVFGQAWLLQRLFPANSMEKSATTGPAKTRGPVSTLRSP